jgi:hypothetical protein
MHSISDDTVTLGEAIEQMRIEEDPSGEITKGMSDGTAAAFDMHDAVHVLFGCGTSLKDEIAAHVWMKFGTTARVADMHKAVANQEHRKALSGIGHLKLIRTWVTMIPSIASIIVRARRMTKPIPFEELPALKKRSVAEIRREHGIMLA